ncbi:MFS transporter [Ancylobacter lacus]|uniref:MFS transporter n=1 Tax=Ancylobacter lacus TaxID=2579970 RepID=UPI001FEBB33C|nr:MFS transporter [Ancylobacter lacus]
MIGFGLANFFGTPAAGTLIERSLKAALLGTPLLMAALGLALVTLQADPAVHTLLFALWGFAFGGVPVAWSSWRTRAVPDQTETAGGLFGASVPLAISVGAAGGGAILAVDGVTGTFAAACLLLVVAALIVLLGVRTLPGEVAQPRCTRCMMRSPKGAPEAARLRPRQPGVRDGRSRQAGWQQTTRSIVISPVEGGRNSRLADTACRGVGPTRRSQFAGLNWATPKSFFSAIKRAARTKAPMVNSRPCSAIIRSARAAISSKNLSLLSAVVSGDVMLSSCRSV